MTERARSVYVTGDTVWFEGVEQVARRYHVATIVLFTGRAKVKERGSDALTMTTADALEKARAFPTAAIVPLHYEGWEHFTEGHDHFLRAYAAAGLSGRLRMLDPGQSTSRSSSRGMCF